jgi:hypothetical protein
LKEKGLVSKNILTLIDFSMSSNAKRLWVINLTTNTILYNSLVAHGGIQEMNLLPVFQIQLNRIRVALDFMLQAKYTAENTENHSD